MSRLGPRRGLYAITDAALSARRGLEADVAAAIRGGAVLIQYRDKSGDAERRRQQAAALLKVCRQYGVPLIINDDVELARALGADGVHLGAEDASLRAARARLGPEAIIGISCYDSLELARKARTAGADYIAFGAFFDSPTKPAAVRAPLTLLQEACANLRLPVAAIGGITPENGAALIEAGASLLAVISGVFGAENPETAARQYAALFKGRP
ncbi:MAG TPA: thiamine phosphate synthase [Nevskiales bacterium]|nr:thiamine phosphate synthase [Nevskiales bacterium]